MNVKETALPDVKIVEPKVFGDSRGYFLESFSRSRYKESGIDCEFVQDNISYSLGGVVRGLHYQLVNEQSKLIHVLKGSILDVAVDVRFGSPTFGRWIAEVLSDENHRQLFLPGGFAHGFAVIGSEALVSYKCSAPYDPAHEVTIRWNDPQIAVRWNIENPIVSAKDQSGLWLDSLTADQLPRYTPNPIA